MARHALPRGHDPEDDDDQDDDGDGGKENDCAFLQTSSRASVPDSIAWGARLRISFLAIG